jgi:hypothetical protein
MDVALIGILGVVAGSLTTGGVQAWIARRQRLVDARAAARVVWGALSDAVNILNQSQSEKYWTTGIDRLDDMIAVWSEQRITLGRVVDSYGYRVVDTAFSVLRDIEATTTQAQDPVEGYNDVFEYKHHNWRMLALDEGCQVALRAGQTRWDRLRDPREVRRRKARVSGLQPK